MKTIISHQFTSIAAVAAALLISGSIARAGEAFRTNLYCAPRAPVIVRPVREIAPFPVRTGIIIPGPLRYSSSVCAYPAGRPLAPIPVGYPVRDVWVGHSYGGWYRR